MKSEKTSLSRQVIQSAVIYNRLQHLSGELIADTQIKDKAPELSEYYSLFHKNERLCRKVNCLEDKINHVK